MNRTLPRSDRTASDKMEDGRKLRTGEGRLDTGLGQSGVQDLLFESLHVKGGVGGVVGG